MRSALVTRPGILLAWMLGLVALLGCGGEAAPTPTPGYFVTFTPTPQPTKTAEQAAEEVRKITAASANFLASGHLAGGAQCTSCHDPFPPVSTPKENSCMGCHGGSQAKLAALEEGYQYHAPHFGQIACADCHSAHAPYGPKCLICHPACTLH